MPKRPTYDELEQRVKELEKVADGLRRESKVFLESDQEKEAILNSLMEHVIHQDTEMRILWANRAACESANLSYEEIVGRYCYEIWPQRSDPCSDCPVVKAMETGQPQVIEKSTPDGRYWFIQGYPLRDRNDDVMGGIEVTLEVTKQKQIEEALQEAHDKLERRVEERTAELLKTNEQLKQEIEDRKRAEEALRESEEKYRTLTDNSLIGIFIHKDERYVFVNDRFAEMHGYKADELLGKEYKTLLHPDEREVIAERVLKRLKGEPVPYQYEVQRLRKDGKTIWCEMIATVIEYRGKPAVMGNIMDITQRKRAKEHIHTLTHKLMKAQENERQRIANELHDSVAQELSLLKIGWETLFDNHQLIPDESAQKALELSKILQRSISTIRDMAYDLHPPGLDQLGLVPTVYQYCEEFSEKNEIDIDFFAAGLDNLKIPFDLEINLYRLIQEGLWNIKKHAEAVKVTIKLVSSFPNIILRIEDDGQGFNVRERIAAASKEKRMGLRSMEERVSLLNGTMRIKSRPTEGTKIFVEVPYKEKKRIRK